MEPKGTESPLFEGFTVEQWRFITARLGTSTDRAAADAVGLNDKTPAKWPNKPQINAAIEVLAKRAAMGVPEVMNQAALKAVMVVVALLDSEDEAVRLRAAQDLIDRVMGKSTQRQEVSGPGGDVIRVLLTDD